MKNKKEMEEYLRERFRVTEDAAEKKEGFIDRLKKCDKLCKNYYPLPYFLGKIQSAVIGIETLSNVASKTDLLTGAFAGIGAYYITNKVLPAANALIYSQIEPLVHNTLSYIDNKIATAKFNARKKKEEKRIYNDNLRLKEASNGKENWGLEGRLRNNL